MRLVKTGKSIMNITEAEANELMIMVYGSIRRGNIPKVTSIALNDEDDCNMLVTYKDDLDTIEFIFMEDDIQKVSGNGYVSAKIKIEFLINHGYLKIEE